MAQLVINSGKILENIKKINDFLEKYEMEWTLITKVLCGDKDVLEKILFDPEIKRIHSLGDSRLSSLKAIKEINRDIATLYIKPPAIENVEEVIKYSDISLNSSLTTMRALDEEARKQEKVHRAIIMLEMGELREGILRENIIEFYRECFRLENVNVVGIGTNLGCMYGVEPTYDKLLQLSLYKQLLEEVFDKKLRLISGGTSITLPLVDKGKIPPLVNHFRVGEAAFLGKSPLDNSQFMDLSVDVFEYNANIVELEEKEYVPDGVIGEAAVGDIETDLSDDVDEKSYKAIVDFGKIDVDTKEIDPKDKDISFVGTTSDLTVYDLGDNKDDDNNSKYHVGHKMKFSISYMGAVRLMNSKFIERKSYERSD